MTKNAKSAGVSVGERLASLPASEHAILLNRFKFLSLVQRVAAADVAEMINTVGLEALTYKSALENVPPPFPSPPFAATPSSAATHRPNAKGNARRRTATPTPATEAQPKRPRRFRDPTEERRFIERLSRPAPPVVRAAGAVARRSPFRPDAAEGGDTFGCGESDAVNLEDSSDDPPPPAAHRHTARSERRTSDAETLDGAKRPPVPTPILRRGERKGAASELEDASRIGTASPDGAVPRVELPPLMDGAASGRYASGSPLLHTHDTMPSVASDLNTPRALNSSISRSRGHFAPKAKPKAAAESPRIPLEVIRHASALLAQRKPAFALSATQGECISSNSAILTPGNAIGSLESIPSNANASLLLQRSATRPAGHSADEEVRTPGETTNRTRRTETSEKGVGSGDALSETALAELAISVERMLRDHRAILEGMVKEEPMESPPRVTKTSASPPQALVSQQTIPKRSSQRAFNISNLLKEEEEEEEGEDLSDVEDELLMMSRLQRQVGLMDRELEEMERNAQDGVSDPENEDVAVRRALGEATRRTKTDDRHVMFEEADERRKNTKPSKQLQRRRGEMPRAITERLLSFQKENHEYIRYTERLWNSSHVTEQVFAQRLTDSLVEDAFQEVFNEVSEILDEYVEGLALHELQ